VLDIFQLKFSAQQKAESAVSDLAPSRPKGTLSQVRYRALGVSAIEEKNYERFRRAATA
jgi:hypothetical protein